MVLYKTINKFSVLLCVVTKVFADSATTILPVVKSTPSKPIGEMLSKKEGGYQ